VESLRADAEWELPPSGGTKAQRRRKARALLDLSDVLDFGLLNYRDRRRRDKVVAEGCRLMVRAQELGLPEAFVKEASTGMMRIERLGDAPAKIFPRLFHLLTRALLCESDFTSPGLMAWAQEGSSLGFFSPTLHPELTTTLLRSDSNDGAEVKGAEFRRACSGPGCTVRCTTKGKGMLSRCPQCRDFFYCGPVCWKAHWQAGHKGQCSGGRQAAPAAAAAPAVDPASCASCGEERVRNSCSLCKQVRYCGRACQAAHWKGGHREQCPLLVAAAETMATAAQDHVGAGGNSSASKEHKEKKKKGRGPPAASCDLGGGLTVTSVASPCNGLTPEMLGDASRSISRGNGNRFVEAMEAVRASFAVGMVVGVLGEYAAAEEKAHTSHQAGNAGQADEEGAFLAFVVVLRREGGSRTATVEGVANCGCLVGAVRELPLHELTHVDWEAHHANDTARWGPLRFKVGQRVRVSKLGAEEREEQEGFVVGLYIEPAGHRMVPYDVRLDSGQRVGPPEGNVVGATQNTRSGKR